MASGSIDTEPSGSSRPLGEFSGECFLGSRRRFGAAAWSSAEVKSARAAFSSTLQTVPTPNFFLDNFRLFSYNFGCHLSPVLQEKIWRGVKS
jgi:hypothetical protein